MFRRLLSMLAWFLNLFNPPPRDEMEWRKKVTRVLLVTASLVVGSIFAAMVCALVIFIGQRGGRLFTEQPKLARDLAIILTGLGVNAGCVLVLLEIRKADRRLAHPPDSGKP